MDIRRFCKAGIHLFHVFIPSWLNQVIETVTTLASSSKGYNHRGGLDAGFDIPIGICMNANDQCFYICDAGNSSVRKLTMQGTSGWLVNTIMKLANTHLRWCDHICWEEHTEVSSWNSDRLQKELLLCDWLHQTYGREDYIVRYLLILDIRFFYIPRVIDFLLFFFEGTITLFAGSGTQGSSDGVGANASFYGPRGIAVDQQTGNIFISDHVNSLIRKITPQGVCEDIYFACVSC